MPTPGVIEYPAALDTALTLIELLNNASSTLTGNISVGDLLIPVADPGKFPNSGFATLVDSLSAPTKIEIFRYESKSGSNLVVPSGGRGQQGSTAFAFSTGNFVEQRPTARHHTVLVDLLLLLEAKLGIGADTPAAGQALFSDSNGASSWRALAQADVTGLAAALADKISKSDTSLQQIVSTLQINKLLPELLLNHSGSLARITADANNLYINRTNGQDAITVELATKVTTFGAIPLLPAADPTTSNQAARKAYVDSRKTWWSINWPIADPSTFPLNSLSQVQQVGMPFTSGQAQTFTATEIWLLFGSGSASGSFTVEIRKHAFNSTSETTLGSVTANPGTLGIRSDFDATINSPVFAVADYVYPVLTARSSPMQRDVTITLIGYQNPTS
jgi:hypothetical protein